MSDIKIRWVIKSHKVTEAASGYGSGVTSIKKTINTLQWLTEGGNWVDVPSYSEEELISEHNDADLVLSQASRRITTLQEQLAEAERVIDAVEAELPFIIDDRGIAGLLEALAKYKESK